MRCGTPTGRPRRRSSARRCACGSVSRSRSAGRCAAGTSRSLTRHGARLPFGEPGELAIGGVGLARYIDATLDAERFAPVPGLGWERAYRTGDIGYETVDGLQFVGRRDDQVKLAGRRLELGEIDGQMSAVPGRARRLRGRPDDDRRQPGARRLRGGQRRPRGRARARSPGGCPAASSRWSSSSTRCRSAARARSTAGRCPGRPRRAGRRRRPRSTALSETEAWLAARWAEQLGPLPITAESDFFALGGTRRRRPSSSRCCASGLPPSRSPTSTSTGGSRARRAPRRAGGRAPAPAQDAADRQRRWGLAQLAGVLALLVLSTPQWLIGILAFDNLTQGGSVRRSVGDG